METRIALLGIIVEDLSVTEHLNKLLHEYSEYLIGRMGIPYRARGVGVISVMMDAPENVISTLAGRIGQLQGLTVKTMYSKK